MGSNLTRGLIKVRIPPFFFKTVIASDLFLAVRLATRFVGRDKQACLVRQQKAHALRAIVTLLTSIIKISPLYTLGPMVLTNGRVGSHKPFFSISKGKKVRSNE